MQQIMKSSERIGALMFGGGRGNWLGHQEKRQILKAP